LTFLVLAYITKELKKAKEKRMRSTDTSASIGTFLPAFGNRPAHIVGRDEVIADFLDGLGQSVGHRKRASILIGQRGTGKTALLLEFADHRKPGMSRGF
jgi:ATP-dependent Clp protease ATP-binding subunit ClpA